MTNGNSNTWKYLIEQYLNNTITKERLDQLLQKAEQEEDSEDLTAALKSCWEEAKIKEYSEGEWDAKFDAMMEIAGQRTFEVTKQARQKSIRIYYLMAAVVVALLIGSGIYFFGLVNNKQKIISTNTQKADPGNDLLPGREGAILTLSNGKQIVLDSAGNGILAVQANTKIVNTGGQIIYTGENSSPDTLQYNTMTVPNGRQYKLVLADGSKVWLNASSSIHYPIAFKGKERNVEITGEAYFEIAHNEQRPFSVSVNGMKIQVLGTHFNINAYDDEATTQTTLLEGSVKVTTKSHVRMLLPGQQARINNSPSGSGDIKILNDVNVEEVMAWKNGYFYFEQTDMVTVMRQIGRWYDVDIEYEGKIPDRKFGGEISRSLNAAEVLRILKESKVNFRIEGRKIIVEP